MNHEDPVTLTWIPDLWGEGAFVLTLEGFWGGTIDLHFYGEGVLAFRHDWKIVSRDLLSSVDRH